ncbi:unnamed protein product [Agarophyton chilense]
MIAVVSFFLLFCIASTGILEDLRDIDCSSYDPKKKLQQAGEGAQCLTALQDPLLHPKFDVCKKGICFLFLREAPFVIFNHELFGAEENRNRMQLPFLCKNPRRKHCSISGFAFNILKATSAEEEYCVWAGPLSDCTWNTLAEFAAMMGEREGYQFVVLGPMLETPARKCSLFASSSWWSDKLVVIGRNSRESMLDINPIQQLIRPFQWETWIVVGGILALFFIVCILILYRFQAFRKRTFVTAITAFFIFVGEADEAFAAARRTEIDLNQEDCDAKLLKAKSTDSNNLKTSSSLQNSFIHDSSLSNSRTHSIAEDQKLQDKEFPTKFSLSTSLFRISIITFIAIFSLFYEVAVVNFLFQQQNHELTKDIEHLTVEELQQYCVVRDTAIEAIWNFRVNPGGSKFDDAEKSQIPWKRCQNGAECLSWILDDDNPVQFYITYELEGTHLIKSRASCESVTIFETKRSIHHFNSGWLFNEQVPTEKRRKLDRELMALKMDGTISSLVGGRADVCEANSTSSITYAIILIPAAFLVFPPLLCSAVVGLWWHFKKRSEELKQLGDAQQELRMADGKNY